MKSAKKVGFALLGIVVTLLIGVEAALAGPPLICHPYLMADRAEIMAVPQGVEPTSEWIATRLMETLNEESETLVCFQAIQNAGNLVQNLPESEQDRGIEQLVRSMEARASRAEDRAAAAQALAKEGSVDADLAALTRKAAALRFDAALAVASYVFVGSPSDKKLVAATQQMAAAALVADDDAAIQLALARAVTPLMNSGTLAEHAHAFVRAWDLTSAMEPSVARDHLQATLDYDLAHLEAYLLDGQLKAAGREVNAENRLAALREAIEGPIVLEEAPAEEGDGDRDAADLESDKVTKSIKKD